MFCSSTVYKVRSFSCERSRMNIYEYESVCGYGVWSVAAALLSRGFEFCCVVRAGKAARAGRRRRRAAGARRRRSARPARASARPARSSRCRCRTRAPTDTTSARGAHTRSSLHSLTATETETVRPGRAARAYTRIDSTHTYDVTPIPYHAIPYHTLCC